MAAKRTRKKGNKTKFSDQMKSRLKKARKPKILNKDEFFPTGCTMLNLACSDLATGGFPLGRITSLPGSSTAGKSIVALSSLASCAIDPRFDDYLLIFDDVEQRQDFDIQYLFGYSLTERMQEPPLGISDTIQNFQNNILKLNKGGSPFIYILDSFDALSSDEELEKDMRKMLAAAKTEEAASKISGSYNTEKAKIAGKILREIKKTVAETRSAVVIIQQLRENIGGGPYGKKYKTSGGQAPFFYSHVRPLLKKIKTHKQGRFKIGVKTEAELEKNSVTGKLATVEFDIFYDLGIDDTASMIDFLVSCGHWKKRKKSIYAVELDILAPRKKLVEKIEFENLDKKLINVCQTAWDEINKSLRMNRRKRF